MKPRFNLNRRPSLPKRTLYALALGLTGFLATPAMLSAASDIVVEDRIFVNGEKITLWATHTLQTMDTVTVQAGANVWFGAGQILRLAPGFSVRAGSHFHASAGTSAAYSPNGYYGGTPPALTHVWPLQPTTIFGAAGLVNFHGLDFAVWNAAGTAPLDGAPVLVLVESGGAWLSATNDGNNLVKTLQLTADAFGTVQFYIKQAAAVDDISVIRVIAGGSSFTINTRSYDGGLVMSGSDTDSDGLPDTLETVLGTNPTVPAEPSFSPELVVF